MTLRDAGPNALFVEGIMMMTSTPSTSRPDQREGGSLSEAQLRSEAETAISLEMLQFDHPKNATELAETIAFLSDHPEWVQDPDHWIWDLCAERFMPNARAAK